MTSGVNKSFFWVSEKVNPICCNYRGCSSNSTGLPHISLSCHSHPSPRHGNSWSAHNLLTHHYLTRFLLDCLKHPLISFVKFFKALCAWLSGKESPLASYQIKSWSYFLWCRSATGREELECFEKWGDRKNGRLRRPFSFAYIPLYQSLSLPLNSSPLITSRGTQSSSRMFKGIFPRRSRLCLAFSEYSKMSAERMNAGSKHSSFVLLLSILSYPIRLSWTLPFNSQVLYCVSYPLCCHERIYCYVSSLNVEIFVLLIFSFRACSTVLASHRYSIHVE